MAGLTDAEWREHRERRGYVDPKPGLLAYEILENMRKRFNRVLGQPWSGYRDPGYFLGLRAGRVTVKPKKRPSRITVKLKEKPCCLLYPHPQPTQADPAKTQVQTADGYTRKRVEANVFDRLEVRTGHLRCDSHSMGGQRCIKDAGHEGWHKGRVVQKDHSVLPTFWGVDP